MFTYELTLLIRNLPKQELCPILKRSAMTIFQKGGIIRKIENLGLNKTPFKMFRNGSPYREALYFIYSFTAPPTRVDELHRELGRDLDIIKSQIYKTVQEDPVECTIEDEMKPPPYRPDVIKLIEESKKAEAKKKKFQYNTGLDYYPFQK